MFTVTEAVSIARPREEVFAFLTDARQRARWDASVVSEEVTSPGPLGVDSTIHTRMRVMSREVDFDWRVRAYDPPARMSVESTAGVMPTALLFEFTETATGCDARATITADPTGMMRLVEPMIADSVRASLASGLAKARRLIEEAARG